MTIAVTGASGHLGRLVADQLLASVDPADVVLLTRDPAKLADYADRGVEVRAADFGDAAGLVDALAGVERMLLISTDAVGARVEGHRAAIDAAAKAGVRHVVYTSIPEPTPDNPSGRRARPRGHRGRRCARAGWSGRCCATTSTPRWRSAPSQQAAGSGQLFTNAGDGGAAYVTRGRLRRRRRRRAGRIGPRGSGVRRDRPAGLHLGRPGGARQRARGPGRRGGGRRRRELRRRPRRGRPAGGLGADARVVRCQRSGSASSPGSPMSSSGSAVAPRHPSVRCSRPRATRPRRSPEARPGTLSGSPGAAHASGTEAGTCLRTRFALIRAER